VPNLPIVVQGTPTSVGAVFHECRFSAPGIASSCPSSLNARSVAQVNASGTALDYAGYIGGSSSDNGNGIAVDSAGDAYVTGLPAPSRQASP
jgi:hypothetical protein